MNILAVTFIFAIVVQSTFGQDLNATQRNIVEAINVFISRMNLPMSNLYFMAQTHCDNSVRTLTESLHNFNMQANQAYWAVADVNRTDLQSCMVGVRDTLEPVLQFLRMNCNNAIFDYTTSTVTPIEAELKGQTDELKNAIKSKTDAKCLTNLFITADSLIVKYLNYQTNITTCISNLQTQINSDYVNKFNPQHFAAVALLNNMWISTLLMSNSNQASNFLNQYCNDQTTELFKSVQSSVEGFIGNDAKNISLCLEKGRSMLPATTPFLNVVNQCN